MLFKKLVLENIRSYEHLEISFPKGSILLAGEIGSGKTSILLGLQFALFGLQPGQKGNSILRQGQESASACLELEVDGETVILERSIKKSKSGGITQDINIITREGVREEISTSEMKERVNRLLNYPKEFTKKSNLLYKFTVYTPQEEMKSIIEERPEVRLDTLRHIFGIDRYKRIKENASIFLQKVKDAIKIKEVLITELNLLREKFVIEQEKKILIAKEVNNLTIEHSQLLEKREITKQKFDLFQDKIEHKKDLTNAILNKRALLSGKRDLESRLQKDLFLMKKQLEKPCSFSEDSLREVINLLEKHQKILEIKNNEYQEIRSSISVLESKKEHPLHLQEKVVGLENCPTCFQKVGEEHKEKITKRTRFDIEDIDRELEQKIILKGNLSKEIEKEKELVKNYESDKNKLKEDKILFEHQKTIETKMKSDAFVLERTHSEIESLLAEIGELEQQLEKTSSEISSSEDIKEQFERMGEDIKSLEISLASKTRELEILKKILEDLAEDIKKKESIREHIVYLRNLQDWLSDKFISMITLAEKQVMTKLRSEFSRIFNEWFSMLASDSLSVRLDEEFTPLITNQDYDIDYDFLSGGERTAVALAYRLALNQVLNSMLSSIKTKDIVILDEPTDGFASEQIDKMRDIFEELNAEQMILVSHEQKIEGFVDHVLRVRKEGSSLVE